MSKQIKDNISLFKTNAHQAYKNLISSKYYYFGKDSEFFYSEFLKLDLKALSKENPEFSKICFKTGGLYHFHKLKKILYEQYSIRLERIKSLSPNQEAVIKSIFLCLEIGESIKSDSIIRYSNENLVAIKEFIKKDLEKISISDKTEYSIDLIYQVYNLIKIKSDLIILDEFIDIYMWADFVMHQKEDKNGFILDSSNDNPKNENLYILNQLKKEYKKITNRIGSNIKISDESHFQKIDPKFKTNEGYAAMITSNIKVTKQPEGTTFLNVGSDFFGDFDMNNQNEMSKIAAKALIITFEQHFHVNYRNFLAQIYQPNDVFDIHSYHIELVNNTIVSVYDLVSAMSCLRAFAFLLYQSIAIIKDNGTIVDVSNYIYPQIELDTKIEKDNACLSEIAKEFIINSQRYDNKSFFIVSKEVILNWLIKIDELKDKSKKELESIIDLFASNQSPLPFNPFYKLGEEYFFSYNTCIKHDLAQHLYDYYISDYLFNSTLTH